MVLEAEERLSFKLNKDDMAGGEGRGGTAQGAIYHFRPGERPPRDSWEGSEDTPHTPNSRNAPFTESGGSPLWPWLM